MKDLIVVIAFLLACAPGALAQTAEFRWLNRKTSPSFVAKIKAAFRDELSEGMTLKKVGLRGNSALVLIGQGERQDQLDNFSRAFSYDLQTHTKTPLRKKGVEVFWVWRLERVTHFTSNNDTEVVFQFLTCTECESERILSSFHFSSKTGTWQLRDWSKEGGPGLLIGSDVQYGDDGFYYYDCLHAVADVTGDGVDDVAVRCRERVQSDPDKPQKRVTRDETLLYTADTGEDLMRIVIGKGSKYTSAVHDALCSTAPNSPLCRTHR